MTEHKLGIEPLTINHIEVMAELTFEIEGFAEFVSKLGIGYLKKIYFRNMLERSWGFAVNIDGDFAGYLINTSDLDVYYKHITTRRRLASIPYIFKLLFTNPMLFLELMKYKFFIKKYVTEDVKGEMILFAVKERYRTPKFLKETKINVAKILLENTLEGFKNRKVEKVKLEVPASNVFAQVFYKSYGFQKVGEIEFNKVKRNIYIKEL